MKIHKKRLTNRRGAAIIHMDIGYCTPPHDGSCGVHLGAPESCYLTGAFLSGPPARRTPTWVGAGGHVVFS